jgi:hypothetical protein
METETWKQTGVKEGKRPRGLPRRLIIRMTRVARSLKTHCHIVCLAVALNVELVRPAEPSRLCVCSGRSAASILLLPLVC